MALPSEWNQRTVERIYIDGTGAPMTGTVSFIANIPVENDDESIVILPKKVTGTLDVDGKLSIALRVTDDEDMRNQNFTYRVTEALTYPGGGKYDDAYNVLIPSGLEPVPEDWPVLQLGKQAPIPPSAGVVIVGGTQGPAGPAGPTGPAGAAGSTGPGGDDAYEIAVAQGFSGTKPEWLLSLKGDPGDTSGLATVAGSGLASDLNTTGWNYAMLVAERQTQAILAAKVMVACDYNPLTSSFDATPDSRLRVCFFSDAAHDPGSAAKERDVWFVEAS